MKVTVLVIPGVVPSKKNGRANTKTGRSFPNKKFMAWERDVRKYVKEQGFSRVTSYPCRMEFKFFYPDKVRRDMDNAISSILDALQPKKATVNGVRVTVDPGLIDDDSWRHVSDISAKGYLDKDNPRAIVEIFQERG